VHAPGALVGRLPGGTRQEDGELVATQAEQQVPGAQRRPQAVAQSAQEVVARVVTEPVVDGLEPVEVEHDQGDPTSAADQDVHLRLEGPAVRQPGEVVGGRLAPDLVQRPELLKGEGAPGQRGEHAGEGADLAHAQPAVSPLEGEHGEGGHGTDQRHDQGVPAGAGGR
jgi:hypothetical protein